MPEEACRLPREKRVVSLTRSYYHGNGTRKIILKLSSFSFLLLVAAGRGGRR